MSDPHITRSKKIWVPLENNPDVMTRLAHRLGLSEALAFQDVYSLTEPDLLAMIPRPVHALLYLCPISEEGENHFRAEQDAMEEYTGSGPDEPVIFYKQTIGNACGLIGLLHCISNGAAKDHIMPGSELDKLIQAAIPLKMHDRAELLYNSAALERAHKEAAQSGDSKPPGAEEHVGFGFTAFVRGNDGHLYDLEGRRKGPVDRGVLGEEVDLLSQKALELGPLKLINREKASEGRFSIIALTNA